MISCIGRALPSRIRDRRPGARSARSLIVALAVAVGLLVPATGHAATLTWWATGSTGSAGGTGTWDTTNARWTSDGSTWSPWSNTNVDTAIFAGTAGTVTLNTGITAGGLTFDTTGYTISGSTLTLAGGTAALSLGSGISGTISSVIAGSAVLQKTGAGTLTLTGTNSFSGNVIVSAGTIRLSSGTTAALGPSNTAVTKVTVNSGGTVDLNGTLSPMYGYTISGSGADGSGAIVNTGGAINNSTPQTTNVKLAADAAIGGSGNWSFLALSYGATTLDLAGFTLTKTGSNIIYLCNTTATSGTIRIAAGTLSQVARDNSVANVAFTLDNVSGAALALNDRSMTIGSLAGGGPTGGNVGLGFGGYTLTTGSLNTSTTYSGAIAGNGNLVKTGTGTFTLAGSNSFTGNVIVNAGTIKLGSSNALGASNTAVTKVTVNSGAAVDFNGTANLVYGYTISGSGADGSGALVNTGSAISSSSAQLTNVKLAADAAIGGSGNWSFLTTSFGTTTLDLAGFTLTKAGSNTISLCNTTATSGTIRIAAGTLSQVARDNSVASVAFTLDNVSGAALALNDRSMTIGSLAGGGSAGGNVSLGSYTLTTGSLNASTTYSGAIAGTGGLVKTGTGTFTLTGSNSFSGNVIVNAGTIKIGSSNALGAVSYAVTKVTVNSGAAVDLNGQTEATYGYTISGSGADGSGAIVNSGAAIGTNAKQTTNVRLAADAAIGGSGNWAILGPSFGATTLDLAGFTLTKAGSNTISLCNTTATSGTIRIAAGTLSQVARDNSVANVAFMLDNVSGAALQLNDRSMTIGSLAGGGSTGGNVSLGSHTLTTGTLNTSTTYSGAIAGTGALVKVGTGALVLGGVNTYSGATTIASGTLEIGGSGVLGNGSYAGTITNSTSFIYSSSANQTLSGVISGAGSIAKSGVGTLTLSNAANGFTGGATLSAGVLSFVSGGLGSSGTVSLGGGTLQWAGGNTQDISSRLALANSSTTTLDIGSNNVTFVSGFGAGSSGGLTKTGGGTLVLSGSNSFTGATDIAAGALVVEGSLAGAVNVASGATLAGTGSLGGLATVANGGSLAPGNGGPGTLFVAGGGLSLADAAILNFQLSPTIFSAGGGINDLVAVTGDITLDGMLNVAAIGGGDFTGVPNYTSWRLFNYSGTLTNNGLSFSSMPSLGGDRSYAVDTSTVGQVNLVIVPEPTSFLIAGIGIAGAAWAAAGRRRRMP